MPKTFLVSDESINSYRCRVLANGGDTSAFESNPVMLFMHLRGNVIGKWANLRIEGGLIYADPIFDLDDNGLGKEIGGKVEREFLNAASIGIEIVECEYNQVLECYDISKWRLQEISIVDIGSNANALQLYDKAGEPITDLKLASHLEQFKPTPTNPTISTQEPMALQTIALALALGLAETATEDEIMKAAGERKSQADALKELNELKLTIANNQTSEATTLVDAAIRDKRIPATSKDLYLKLFKADHESAKTALANMVKPQNLVGFAANGAAQSMESQNETDVKTFDEMHKKGTLALFKQNNPDEYKRLYKAKYGKELA